MRAVAGLRAFSVSLGCLMAVSFPCVLIVTMLLSEAVPHLFPLLVLVNVIVAFLVALGQGDRIYAWWLRGYPDYVPSQGIVKSGPKRSLKERLHAWWMSGYDYEHAELGNLTLERVPETLEQTSEHKEALEQTLEPSTVAPASLERALEQTDVPLEHRNSTLEPDGRCPEKPSRGDLGRLKEVMNLEKGSMQYKEKGNGVYLAVYNAEKKGYVWNHLGSWTDLRQLICQEDLA